MNEVLDRSGGMRDFLGDPELQRQYFSRARSFYRAETLSREHFERLISQVDELIEKNPEFESRFWMPRKHEPIRFEIPVEKTRSDGINLDEWNRFLESWRETLRSRVAGAYSLDNRWEFEKEAKPLLALLRAETQEFKKALAQKKLTRLPRMRAERDFYRNVMNRPEIVRIAAASVFHRLQSPETLAVLQSQNAARILHLISSWYQNTRAFVHPDLREFAGPLSSVLKAQLPKYSELKKNERIFTPVDNGICGDHFGNSVRRGVYHFAELSRPIHDLWSGAANNDCFAFDSNRGPIVNRWALFAQSGIRILHIRTEFAYYGAIHLVPIQKDGQTWGCLELWSWILPLVPILSEPEPNEGKTFFEILIEELNAQLPGDWKGVCISFNPIVDNYASETLLGHLPLLRDAPVLGRFEDFSLPDAIFDKIPKMERDVGPFHLKNARMIHAVMPDPTGKQSGPVYALTSR